MALVAAGIGAAAVLGSAYISSQSAGKGGSTQFDLKTPSEYMPYKQREMYNEIWAKALNLPAVSRRSFRGKPMVGKGPGIDVAERAAASYSPIKAGQTTTDPGAAMRPYAAALAGIGAGAPGWIKEYQDYKRRQQQQQTPGADYARTGYSPIQEGQQFPSQPQLQTQLTPAVVPGYQPQLDPALFGTYGY